MGNKKNRNNTNAHRGKCRKKPPSKLWHIQQQHKSDSGLCSSSRIINLQQLADHIAEVTSHAACCTSCTGSGGDTVTLVCEKNRQGLASILVARCSGCSRFQLHPKYVAYQMVMFNGSAILQLYGVKCRLVVDTAPFKKVWPHLESCDDKEGLHSNGKCNQAMVVGIAMQKHEEGG